MAFLYYDVFEDCELLGDKYLDMTKRILLRAEEKITAPEAVKERDVSKFYFYPEEH